MVYNVGYLGCAITKDGSQYDDGGVIDGDE